MLPSSEATAETGTNPTAQPLKISSADILKALGLQRRRSAGRTLAVALGLLTAGALLGAVAVVVRALVVGDKVHRFEPEART